MLFGLFLKYIYFKYSRKEVNCVKVRKWLYNIVGLWLKFWEIFEEVEGFVI